MSAKTYLSLISLMTVITGVAVIVCVVVTNPLQIGPLGVTLWFVGVLGFLQGIIALMLIGLKRRLVPTLGEHKRITSSWRQGLLLGGEITVLLALSSLRQLGWRDAILITGLLALGEFYFRTRT